MPRQTIRFEQGQVPYLQVLDAESRVDADLEPDLGDDTLRHLFRAMVRTRRFDEARLRLQRQGRIGTFAPVQGQEAAQLGSVVALEETDWVVPSFRETAAQLWRGMPMERDLLYAAGYEEGIALPEDAHDLPLAIPVASQLPHAVGIAWARKLQRRDEVVLAYFGDGATSQGDFHEAMNFAGVFQVPCVFLCQNNQWAISVPRSRQTHSRSLAQKALAYDIPGVVVDGNDILAVYRATREAVDRARQGGGPTMIEAVTYRMNVHTTADDPKRYRSDEEVEAWRDRDPLTRFQAYLEHRGLVGKDDAARIGEEATEEVRRAVQRFEELAQELGDPLAMFDHAYAESPPPLRRQRDELASWLQRVRKGEVEPPEGRVVKVPAEAGPSRDGGEGARGEAQGREAGPEQPPPRGDQRGLTMVEALNLALREEMERDERVMVLGEDVGVNGGVFRVTQGLQETFGEDRTVDTPLAESAILGTSIGLAVGGMLPIAEMQFSGFSYFAFHQLENHAARLRKRSQGRFACPLVVRTPYGAGIHALEHHSDSREAYFAHTPGIKVVVPSSPRTAHGLLKASIRDPDPVVFLEPSALYRAFREEVPAGGAPLELGKAEVTRPGGDLTLVAYGAMHRRAMQAAERLAREDGKEAEVIDLQTLSPLDSEAVNASVRKTGRCMVVHEAPRSFGPAGEIAARIHDDPDTFLRLEAPVARITGYDVHPPLFAREAWYLPDVPRILDAARRTLAF